MFGLKEIRDQADRIFARLVKLRAADDQGYVKCVTCGRRMQWDSPMSNCGHFRRRWHQATRYLFSNCVVQCMICNNYGPEANLRAYMVKTYGEDAVDDLVRRSNQICTDRIEDYRELIREWKEELCERGDIQSCEDAA